MNRVIVTGAAGFIGGALVDELCRTGVEVVEFDMDFGDVASTDCWHGLPPAQHVFHLAGRSYVPDSWSDPASFMHTNITGTTAAIDYCRRHDASLTFVSAYVYGSPERLPIREGDPIRPSNPYALSKRLAEQVCEFSAREFAIPTCVLRPFNVFGPGQRKEFLIPSLVAQLRSGSDQLRVSDLTPKRDYIYLTDVVDALLRTRENTEGYAVYNIGTGVSYSVREVIETIQQAAGTQLAVLSDGRVRTGEVSDVRADISRARESLGWEPKINFIDGIAEVLSGLNPLGSK